MNLRDLAFGVMITIVIALGIYLIFYVHSESYSCMKSPLTYGVSKYSTIDNFPIYCTCNLGKAGGITFTKYNLNYTNGYESSVKNISELFAKT